MVNLVTSDNKTFTVDGVVAKRSALIRTMLEDIGESDLPIPVPNVSSSVMEKIIEYCEHHRSEPLPATDIEFDEDNMGRRVIIISPWDQQFISTNNVMLFEIILAANYLDIKPLLNLGCKTVADMIKGKNPEEIRKLFNIDNDLSPEDEAQIREENKWAEDR